MHPIDNTDSVVIELDDQKESRICRGVTFRSHLFYHARWAFPARSSLSEGIKPHPDSNALRGTRFFQGKS